MPYSLVVFGASGDLTSRKLVPALYQVFRRGRLPQGFRMIGFSRTEWSHDAWRESLAKTTAEFAGKEFDPKIWQDFAKLIFYQPGDISQPKDFERLRTTLEQLES